jgi:predicted nucleotidyltransferase
VRDPYEGVAADGTITTGVARSRVPERFGPVLLRATEAITTAGRDTSAYLYGSVATGQARPGQSDVDLLAFGLDRELARSLGGELSTAFSRLCRGVEIVTATPGDLAGESDEAYGFRVFLRHYCLQLAGPGYGHELPRFPADARAARGFNGDIGQHAARWRDALAAGHEPARLGRLLARKTLLAVAGLVSVHDVTWTTDRARAAHRWAEIEPGLEPELYNLLSWSDGLTQPGPDGVQHMLDTAVPRITATFAENIGLWPS